MSFLNRCRVLAATAVVATGLATLGTSEAHGALLISSSGIGGIIFNANVGSANTLGFQLNVGGAPLKVTSLGFFDTGLDGLPSPVMVGLWKVSTAQQVAAVTVPAGTAPTLVNDYRFVTLTSPVTLDANTSYIIGYRSAQGGLLQDGRDRTNQGVAPQVTIPAGGFGLRHSTAFEDLSTDFATQMPASNLGDTVPLTGPNMQFTVVPEPASGLCLIVGSTALFLRRTRP